MSSSEKYNKALNLFFKRKKDKETIQLILKKSKKKKATLNLGEQHKLKTFRKSKNKKDKYTFSITNENFVQYDEFNAPYLSIPREKKLDLNLMIDIISQKINILNNELILIKNSILYDVNFTNSEENIESIISNKVQPIENTLKKLETKYNKLVSLREKNYTVLQTQFNEHITNKNSIINELKESNDFTNKKLLMKKYLKNNTEILKNIVDKNTFNSSISEVNFIDIEHNNNSYIDKLLNSSNDNNELEKNIISKTKLYTKVKKNSNEVNIVSEDKINEMMNIIISDLDTKSLEEIKDIDANNYVQSFIEKYPDTFNIDYFDTLVSAIIEFIENKLDEDEEKEANMAMGLLNNDDDDEENEEEEKEENDDENEEEGNEENDENKEEDDKDKLLNVEKIEE